MRSLTILENIRLTSRYLFEYKDFKAFQYKSEAEISVYQLNRIKEIVTLAYNQTAFYRNKYSSLDIHPNDIRTWKDFNNLPTVTKQEIIDNKNDCIINTVRSREDLILSRSSGSSGKVLDIILDADFFISKALNAHRFYDSIMDFHKDDKQVLIYTSKYPYRSMMGFFKAEYVHNLEKIHKIFQFIKAEKPALIAGYPSVLIELIHEYGNELKTLQAKAICTHSEHSTRAEREYISKIFGCPVYDEYSTEELSKCAYECTQHSYHIQEDSAYLEIMDENTDNLIKNGELGEIVGTSLYNVTMPFIRYRQGDLGSIVQSQCPCGRKFRVLKNIAGRKNDSFRLKNGSSISSGEILDWTYELLLNYMIPIKQFKIVQTTIDKAEFTLIPDKSYIVEKHNKKIVDSFKKEYGDVIELSVKLTNSISKTPAGKHNAIRSFV